MHDYYSHESGKQLIYIEGNVTTATPKQSNETIIIPHCCNTLRLMGAGVALALRNKWPIVFNAFAKASNELGTVSYVKVENNIVVANMIGQQGILSSQSPKPIKYAAIVKAMINVKEQCLLRINQGRVITIHSPQFGSAFAGGKWELIHELIQEIWVDAGIDVQVYTFKNRT